MTLQQTALLLIIYIHTLIHIIRYQIDFNCHFIAYQNPGPNWQHCAEGQLCLFSYINPLPDIIRIKRPLQLIYIQCSMHTYATREKLSHHIHTYIHTYIHNTYIQHTNIIHYCTIPIIICYSKCLVFRETVRGNSSPGLGCLSCSCRS